MKIKKKLFLGILFYIFICDSCLAQFIIAGQTGPGIYYHDFIPDIELNATPSSLPNDTSASVSLDLDQDISPDFNVSAYGGAGVSHSIWTTTITPLNSNQVSYLYNQSVFNPCCSNWTTIFFAKPYSLGDTIRADASFIDSNWRALNYEYNLQGYGSFSIHDWVAAGESYIGLRLITTTDTTYGWLRVESLSDSHIIIKDYAIGNLIISQQENPQFNQIIFLNPIKEKLTLALNKNYKNLKAELYNIFGQRVFEKQYENINTSIEINVASFNKGIYLLKLNDGNESKTFKILIE